MSVLASILLIYIGSASALLFFRLRGQLDRLAGEDLETVEGLLSFAPSGKVSLRSDYHDHPQTAQMRERLLEVLTSDGSLLYRSESLRNLALGGMPDPDEGLSSYSQRSIRLPDGRRVRLASKRHEIEGRPTLIRVGFDEAPLWQNFWQALIGLMAGLPIALGLAGLAGYFLARRALSPIERMAHRAHEIGGDDLRARLTVENPNDELGLLAQAFNETLGRLERSFEQLRRFTSDAAHELRTPLMALRSVGEAGLQEAATDEEYREVVGSMLKDSARLSCLVDSLLIIARADAGQIRLRKLDTAVVPFVREAVSIMEVLAEEKEQGVSFEGRFSAQVQADPVILRQVIMNLLDNAIKHTPHGGGILVRVLRAGVSNVAIEVEDSGPGIAPEHRERVFDRFIASTLVAHAKTVVPVSASQSRNGELRRMAGVWNSIVRAAGDVFFESFCPQTPNETLKPEIRSPPRPACWSPMRPGQFGRAGRKDPIRSWHSSGSGRGSFRGHASLS